VIGLLGGTGAVGSGAARRLAAAGIGPLRIGARDAARAAALAATLPGAGALAVDLHDDAALAAFCTGCRVVVQCAGPSYRILDRVARAALAAGADYVDAAGDEPLRRRLAPGPPGWRAVLSAGAVPGVSGLLPRLVAARARRLDVFVGGTAAPSRAGVLDALLARGPEFGEPGAVWRGGTVVRSALPVLERVVLPGFDGPVRALPFLGVEARELAARSGVGELRAYTVFPGPRVPDALAAAWAAGGDPDDHVERVAAALRADVAEHGEAFTVLASARHPDGVRRARLRTGDPAALTAAVVALAAAAVRAGTVPPGVHLAAQVLDPLEAVAALRDGGADVELPVDGSGRGG
jgi:hypothetical protein